MTPGDHATSVRSRAEARFTAQELRAADARKVVQEISTAKRAEMDKTKRLRALRLAKEEADRVAAEALPKVVKKPAVRKSRKVAVTAAI